MGVDISGLLPSELGLPDSFPEFRQIQIDAIEATTEILARARVAGVCLPTGAGKTLYAMALGKVIGDTAILTATKGLQEQYMREFEQAGLVQIKGKDNYKCEGVTGCGWTSCKYGELEGCKLSGDMGCTYESARWEGRNTSILLTNYAYWVRANRFGQHVVRLAEKDKNTKEMRVVNPFQLLICDEGHAAMEHLAGALRIGVNEQQIRLVGLEWKDKDMGVGGEWDVAEWRGWAKANRVAVESTYREVAARLKKGVGEKETGKQLGITRDKVRQLDRLVEAMDALTGMEEGDWVVEARKGTDVGRIWTFDCVWPAKWAERYLWAGIPKVVVMSATLHPISLNLLGVRKEDREFKAWGPIFKQQNTPVLHMKTVQLNRHVKEEGLKRWVERADEIIMDRMVKGGRKGLFHTVSYARQQYFMENSKVAARYSDLFYANTADGESGRAQDVYEAYTREKRGVALVSPSFSTGWNFPGDSCRWQIIGKVPFPDSRGKVMKARMEREPRYLNACAMQELRQAVGRGTRSEDDWCEVIVIDDSIGWFMWRNEGLAPSWFKVRAVGERLPPMLRVGYKPTYTGQGNTGQGTS